MSKQYNTHSVLKDAMLKIIRLRGKNIHAKSYVVHITDHPTSKDLPHRCNLPSQTEFMFIKLCFCQYCFFPGKTCLQI